MSMMTTGLMSAVRDDWETPPWLFKQLDDEFHFTLDAAANDENHKCRKYFTPKDDSLVQNWGGVHGVLQSTVRKADKEMVQEGL